MQGSPQADPAQLLQFLFLAQLAQQANAPAAMGQGGAGADSFQRGGGPLGDLIRGMIMGMMYQQLMAQSGQQFGQNNGLSGMSDSARMRAHLGEGRRQSFGPSGPQDAGTVNDAQTSGGPANLHARFDSVRNRGARNQMVTGSMTVNGRTYQFRSGGHGRGSLPPGDYQVTAHRSHRSENSMNVGGVGYSFALSDKYDPRVGGTRSLLRIHPDGGSAGTIGCIGIVGNAAVQRQFYADMRAELARNGGRLNLRVG